MRQFKIEPDTIIWVSDDMVDSYDGNRRLIQDTYQGLLGNLSSKEHQYVSLYGRSHKKERIACLHAHGSSENNRWYYQDGIEQKPVQEWIDSLKGQYKMVVLFVCNPGAHTPACKNALLLLSDADLSVLGAKAGICNLNLIHPTEGELEYTLDYELEQLKKKLKRKPAKAV